jgi:hypothetical protein
MGTTYIFRRVGLCAWVCLLNLILTAREADGIETPTASLLAQSIQTHKLEQSEADKRNSLFINPLSADALESPIKNQCITINSTNWFLNHDFPSLTAPPTLTHCVGGTRSDRYRTWMAGQFFSHGYLKTLTGVSSQDEHLVIENSPRFFENGYEEPTKIGRCSFPFSTQKGELFNTRNIDQTLNNICQLPDPVLIGFGLVSRLALVESDVVVHHLIDGNSIHVIISNDSFDINSTAQKLLNAVADVDANAPMQNHFNITNSTDGEFNYGARQPDSKIMNLNVPCASTIRHCNAGLNHVTYCSTLNVGVASKNTTTNNFTAYRCIVYFNYPRL